MPKIGIEEGRINLRVGGGEDVSYCEGEAVEKLVNDFKEGAWGVWEQVEGVQPIGVCGSVCRARALSL